jgi:hypothetical protein
MWPSICCNYRRGRNHAGLYWTDSDASRGLQVRPRAKGTTVFLCILLLLGLHPTFRLSNLSMYLSPSLKD